MKTTASALCSVVNSLPDALISPAPADIGDGGIDVAVGRTRDLREERRGGHDHAALTVAALRNLVCNPGFLNRVRPVFRQAFDGYDLSAVGGRHRHGARTDRI